MNKRETIKLKIGIKDSRLIFLTLGVIFYVISILNSIEAQKSGNELSTYSFLVSAVEEGMKSVGNKLRSDLNDKFLKLSSQIDENDRKVSKTLSIFEKEWNQKTERLTKLEKKQEITETAIMKLTRLFHELSSSHNDLKTKIETSLTSTSTTTSEAPTKTERNVQTTTLRPTTTESYIETTTEEEEYGDYSDYSSLEEAERLAREEEGEDYETTTYDSLLDEYEDTTDEIFENTTENGPEQKNMSSNKSATEEYAVQNDASFYMYGSPTNFSSLEYIPEETQRDLSSIELHYVLIDPIILLTSLQNCSKLRSLKLIQVKMNNTNILTERFFNGGKNISSKLMARRPVLPHLQEFVFDQIGLITFGNETIFSKWSEIDEFLKGVLKNDLKEIVFFDKNIYSSWDVERITSLGTNIELIIDGIKILKIDYEEGEMSSMLKYSNEFLKYIEPQFVLKKLALSAWRLDLSLIPETVTSLNLNYILDSDEGDVVRAFQKLTSLQELNIFIGNMGNSGWASVRLPLAQLKNLTIRYSDMRGFPHNRLLRLNYLYLHYCTLDYYLVEDFGRIFEAVHVGISFRKENVTSFQHHLLLDKILSTPVKWIFMQNFKRSYEGRTSERGKVGNAIYYKIEDFLKRGGISERGESFILELKKMGDGKEKWLGRELSSEQKALTTLSLVGTDKFVTSEAYQKIVD